MPGFGSSQPNRSMTAWGLCLLLLCVVPYVVDSAICEEIHAVTLHASLVDGEEVDSLEAKDPIGSQDLQISTLALRSNHRRHEGSVVLPKHVGSPRYLTEVLVTSRPPPLS